MPKDLLEHLEGTYDEIIRNFHESRFEPSELNGGKFSEAVYRVLEWHTNSNRSYTPFGQAIRNFSDSLKKFENMTPHTDTIRFHIPKLLSAIYSIRNKRGVGHIGGDVNPNHMDATLLVHIARWILAELIRIFHTISLSEAEKIVENLTTKEYPIVWDIGDKKRILDTELTFENKALVLLYSSHPNPVLEPKLVYWLEYSNPSMFRKKIIIPLHKRRLIEYDASSKYIFLSPKGIKFVEQNIDLKG
ncbi:hypothetical protein COV20_06105 [Candidatus Woesearchaeota archaeon CG10_big_fil_rev_8_21_14_0_10_45_16]|nr:MAG: hypothetical protein COV20_06105 [Candidatus Woesearchaeota archaeon CG10_big_fil_rev_8_21_14_0_10_45_16]